MNYQQHPLNRLLEVSLENITKVLQSGQVIGQAVNVGSSLVMPIAKVTLGFGAAGSDFPTKDKKKKVIDYNSEFGEDFSSENKLLFGGGSGGGVSITPCAFLVLNGDSIEIKTVEKKNQALDKVVDFLQQYIEKK